MKSKILWALAVLNIGLALMLVFGSVRENQAMAQRVMRPADYVLIPGDIPGGGSGVVYIIDSSNGMLAAMAYNDSNNTLDVMPALDIARLFQGAGAR